MLLALLVSSACLVIIYGYYNIMSPQPVELRIVLAMEVIVLLVCCLVPARLYDQVRAALSVDAMAHTYRMV